VAVTLSGSLTANELSILVNHSKPRLVFTTDAKLPEMEQLKDSSGLEKIICPGGDLDLDRLMKMGSGSFNALDRNRVDTAAILYTGGTTGIPKGVMLTHEGIHYSAHSVAHFERSTESDVALCFLPFNHVFGQMHIMNATILSSGCLELLPSFEMDGVLEAMQSGRLTKFFAVPTVYMRLLTLGDLEKRLGRLRYCFSAAASMPVEIVRQWKERTGISIAEGYGMTEAMPVSYNHYHRHVVGSVGQPVHGVEVQIRDKLGKPVERGHEGEICVRGPIVMKGYLNDPEGTRAASWDGGWYRSGDVGQVDKGGYLYIIDRLKDMIITGGENVYSREVEEVLYASKVVQECAVIGLPDKEWGERVTAVIVPKPEKKIVPQDLKAFVKARLSAFKVPKEFFVVDEMPKNPAGKILKRELKERFGN
jgi:long-chain acyl-CoA synthetase